MNTDREAYTIREAREKITDIISKTMFGSIDKKDAIPYMTGQTDKEPIETWGFDDNWNQWGNPELDERERLLDLENGYLLGMTEAERLKRIEDAYPRWLDEQKAMLDFHIAEYEEIKDQGRKEAAKAFAKLNLKPIEDKIDAARQDHADIQANTTGTAIKVSTTANAVDWLVSDRMRKKRANAKRGKANQEKGNAEERERAARDMETALNRVHDRMKNGATNVLAECRAVCRKFTPQTSRKNGLGEFAAYTPLTGADGEAIKPETLAKNYRARFGTKKARKARAAKAKRRTK